MFAYKFRYSFYFLVFRTSTKINTGLSFRNQTGRESHCGAAITQCGVPYIPEKEEHILHVLVDFDSFTSWCSPLQWLKSLKHCLTILLCRKAKLVTNLTWDQKKGLFYHVSFKVISVSFHVLCVLFCWEFFVFFLDTCIFTRLFVLCEQHNLFRLILNLHSFIFYTSLQLLSDNALNIIALSQLATKSLINFRQ